MTTRIPQRTHTTQFRDAAVRQAIEVGRTATDVSHSLDISPKTLGNWVRRARRGNPLVKRTTAVQVEEAQAELSRLRSGLAPLRVDNEIVKKGRRRTSRGSRSEARLARVNRVGRPRADNGHEIRSGPINIEVNKRSHAAAGRWQASGRH